MHCIDERRRKQKTRFLLRHRLGNRRSRVDHGDQTRRSRFEDLRHGRTNEMTHVVWKHAHFDELEHRSTKAGSQLLIGHRATADDKQQTVCGGDVGACLPVAAGFGETDDSRGFA